MTTSSKRFYLFQIKQPEW